MSPEPRRLATRTGRLEARSPITISQLPTAVNLILYAGDDFSMVCVVKYANGSPADLSGAVALSHIRQTADSPILLGEFMINVSGNEIALDLSGDVSAQLPRNSVWDLEVTINDRVTTLVAGTITMTPEVTRPVTQ